MKKNQVKWGVMDGKDYAFIAHEKMLITFKKNTPKSVQNRFVDRMLNRDRYALTLRLNNRQDYIDGIATIDKTDTPFSLIISD